ncbi:hypothetical protein L1987_10788 [Smallanthus sonchifolius]|uniref:Uncharacterized protein n=1 Tax=Smallanthus sonchifolius TaxID=185202 RepID=A0ACB9JCK1_9ASTR|nr:hypothetical protein L1987_10788 [Smallanthus sonchifolius]
MAVVGHSVDGIVFLQISNFRVQVGFDPPTRSMALVIQRNAALSFLKMEALDAVHVSKENQENAFAMLAAVLWLGNVTFSIFDNENHVEPVID